MSSTRPNILLITSDQQHWNTLGQRNPQIKTPNLDNLAAQGVTFDRAYCVNPTCTPTRLGPSQDRHEAITIFVKAYAARHPRLACGRLRGHRLRFQALYVEIERADRAFNDRHRNEDADEAA